MSTTNIDFDILPVGILFQFMSKRAADTFSIIGLSIKNTQYNNYCSSDGYVIMLNAVVKCYIMILLPLIRKIKILKILIGIDLQAQLALRHSAKATNIITSLSCC